jgi:multiple antibiotic resistance protein
VVQSRGRVASRIGAKEGIGVGALPLGGILRRQCSIRPGAEALALRRPLGNRCRASSSRQPITMPGSIVEDLITLFVVLDPVGSIPIFLNATAQLEPRDRRKVALFAVLVALLVLMLFLYCGQYALEAMHISIPAFRIAGAAVLFLFALQMIFGGHHASGTAEPSRTPKEIAIFPVAMPGVASPGALLAVVLLTDNNRFSFGEETVTACLTVAVLVIVLILLLLAARIQRYLGAAGIMVITQIMGSIFAPRSASGFRDRLPEHRRTPSLSRTSMLQARMTRPISALARG